MQIDSYDELIKGWNNREDWAISDMVSVIYDLVNRYASIEVSKIEGNSPTELLLQSASDIRQNVFVTLMERQAHIQLEDYNSFKKLLRQMAFQHMRMQVRAIVEVRKRNKKLLSLPNNSDSVLVSLDLSNMQFFQ